MNFHEWNASLKGMLAINGKQGSGKTLLATMMAYDDYLHGKTVYSNYPLNFPHIPVTSVEVIESAKDGTILLDEAYQLADSRRSSSAKNVIISTILAKARKHKLRYVFIQQYWRTVDVRIRLHSDWILFPSIADADFSYNPPRPTALRVMVFTRDEVGDIQLEDVVKIKIPKIVFSLYDTEADVYPFKEPEKRKRKERKLDDYV